MSDTELVKRYLKDLNKEEDDLMKTRNGIKDLETEKNTLLKQLKDLKLETSAEARKNRETLESNKDIVVPNK